MNLKRFVSVSVILLMSVLLVNAGRQICENYRTKKINDGLKQQKELVFDELSQEILANVKRFPGEAGIYIKDLQTGVEFTYNESKPFPSASLVKIPLMAAVFQSIDDGNISLYSQVKLQRKNKSAGSGVLKRTRSGRIYSVEDLLELMITKSDNTATNMLTDQIGMDYANWVFRNKFGLQTTNFNRYIMDLGKRNSGIENYTSAKEMGEILEKIYRGTLINQECSSQMLAILMKQKINDRIPRFLPHDLVVAHKTGLMQDICHDAGIVYTPNGDFIVCVLTGEIRSLRVAKRFIGNVAFKAYQCY